MTEDRAEEQPAPKPRMKWYVPASLLVLCLLYMQLTHQPDTSAVPMEVTAEMVLAAVMAIQGNLLIVVLLCLTFLGFESRSRTEELEMDRFYDADLVRGSAMGGLAFLVVLGMAYLTDRAAIYWDIPLFAERPWGSMIVRSTLGGKIMIGLSTLLVAPIVEEIVFRHTLYRALRATLPHWVAAAISAAIFAVVHDNVGAIPAFFVLALMFQEAYRQTGRLYVPITMHATFNAFMLTFSQWGG